MVASESKPNLISEEKLFHQQEEETFQWTKQWYPVAVIDHLDGSYPHQIQLLGKDLVLWQDGNNKWRCFDDVCPHRLVPLSEGRIESDGTLLCAYHAWRFDGEGNCVKIPQSKDAATEAKNCANSKACAISYPVKELQGLIWVWGESGEEANVESELRQPRIIPELEDKSDRVIKLFWYQRDLPFGWDFYMENVMDPAHVPVSHHGLYGDRYSDAKYYDMIPIRKVSTQEGFSFGIPPIDTNFDQGIQDFQPPCHHRIELSSNDQRQLILVLYAIPTRPGWCRQISCQVLVKNEQGQKPGGFSILGLPIPDWLGHVFSSFFVHQDLVFLHQQEKIIAKRKTGKWIDKVYTPNPQDKMVVTFRNWLEKRAGGGIPWDSSCAPHLPPIETDKDKLFDIYSTHTKDCKICQDALKNINRLTVFSFISSGICLFLALLVDSRNIAQQEISTGFLVAPPLSFWLLVLGAIALAVIGYYLKKLSRLFYIYRFEHHHND
ncbi:Rieske 2Fe-2S domain-containing protein [Cyanothece sp. BG0011]|uniref:aromatic ring-hydroxylating dioxygenase subunit alpha n=1 Tax=Cyanothece sp. BG0011 TaxID=2082950 RepID=UPI0018E53529|nr:Rieske 2Fe-2S domain-containing protein [Cyanothece sp. BG0011]